MMTYLLAAFAIFWTGTFVYVLSLAARQRGLAKKVESLAAAVAEVQGSDS